MSKVIPIFKGRVKDGRLFFSNVNHFNHYLQGLDGKEVDIIVKKKKRIRSLKSNNYYWAYLNIISEETGDDINSLHEYLKRALLTPQIIKVLGKEVQIPASTSNLTTVQMSEYITRISALTGIPAPNPDEFYTKL